MCPEREASAINWDWVFFKKMADVEDATPEFEEKIPEPYKPLFKKEPENIQTFVVLLSLLDDKERQQLKEDLAAGKAKNAMMTAHDLGNCLMLYEIFSGKALPKKGVVI